MQVASARQLRTSATTLGRRGTNVTKQNARTPTTRRGGASGSILRIPADAQNLRRWMLVRVPNISLHAQRKSALMDLQQVRDASGTSTMDLFMLAVALPKSPVNLPIASERIPPKSVTTRNAAGTAMCRRIRSVSGTRMPITETGNADALEGQHIEAATVAHHPAKRRSLIPQPTRSRRKGNGSSVTSVLIAARTTATTMHPSVRRHANRRLLLA